MKKDQLKLTEEETQIAQDIQFLLSSIRARQNGLIFFLEHFNSFQGTQLAQEYRTYKNQFLQKEKIYTNQVNQIINKHILKTFDNTHHLLRGFWLKLKSILKVSLERIKILELLNQKIFQRYESIIAMINKNYDQMKGLADFRYVQASLKKRNVDALILGRTQFLINSQTKLTKNRSQTMFKQQKKQIEIETPFGIQLMGLNPQKQPIHPRLKSLNRYKFKKKQEKYRKVASAKTCQRHYKKFNKNLEKYQKNLQGALQGKLDINFDKRKTIFENVYSIYDSLFQKNIPVHKTISKFIFNSCGVKQLLGSKKNRKLVVKNSQEPIPLIRHTSKFNKGKKKVENSQLVKKSTDDDKDKNLRAKTVKNQKIKKKLALYSGHTLNPKNLLSKIL